MLSLLWRENGQFVIRDRCQFLIALAIFHNCLLAFESRRRRRSHTWFQGNKRFLSLTFRTEFAFIDLLALSLSVKPRIFSHFQADLLVTINLDFWGESSGLMSIRHLEKIPSSFILRLAQQSTTSSKIAGRELSKKTKTLDWPSGPCTACQVDTVDVNWASFLCLPSSEKVLILYQKLHGAGERLSKQL